MLRNTYKEDLVQSRNSLRRVMGKDTRYEGVAMSSAESDRDSRANSRKPWIRSILKNFTVEPLVFLCVASAVFKFVVLPQFLLDTICHRDYAASICTSINLPENSAKQTHIQANAAKWMLGLYSCSLSISLFTVPLLGSLADVVGKKRVLFIPTILYTVQSIVYSALCYKISKLNPAYLVITAVLGGLSGDIVALTMLSASYISDITTEEHRTFRLTLIDGILNLSLCIFMFCSGYIILAVGYSRVFLVSLGIDILSLVCLGFFVPSDAVNLNEKPKPQDSNRKDENGAEFCIEFSKLNKVDDAVCMNGTSVQEIDVIQKDGTVNYCRTVDTETNNTSSLKESGKEDLKKHSKDSKSSQPGTEISEGRSMANQCAGEAGEISKSLIVGIEDNQDEVEVNQSGIKVGEISSSEMEGKSEVMHVGTEAHHDEFEASDRGNEAGEIGTNSKNGKSICAKKLLAECNPIKRFNCLRRLLKEQGKTSSVFVFLIILGLASMCVVGESLTLVLYITNHPFNMDSVNVGYLLSLQGLLRFAGGYLLLNVIFQRCTKWQDINVVSLSFAVNLVYFILLGISNTRQMLYGIQALSIFGPLAGPTLRSAISKIGDSSSHATILSIALTVDAVASFIVNILVNSTYAMMAKMYTGTFCFVLAGISMFGFVMSLIVRRYDTSSSASTEAKGEGKAASATTGE